MSLDENTQIFVNECFELLEDMEQALLELERAPNDAELINRIFRAAHTIKGSSGLFGFDHIISFTHVAENLLDDVRNCLLPINDDLISLLMRTKDYIELLINAVPNQLDDDSGEGDEIMGMLSAFQNSGGQAKLSDSESNNSTSEAISGDKLDNSLDSASEDKSIKTTQDGQHDHFHISLRLGIDNFRQGFDPLPLFDQLREIGEIKEAHLVTEAIPSLSELDAEDCHLGWEIVLSSSAQKNEVASIFDFIDDANVTILAPNSRTEDYLELISRLPEDEDALGQILVKVGSLTAKELQQALNQQKDSGGLTGDILVEQASVPKEIVEVALSKQKKERDSKKNISNFVRVDSSKLDKLVNLVGELVISGAKVSKLTQNLNDEELNESIESMTLAMEDMRETALGLRMVPIGTTFNRFNRVVRDIAKDLGKKIRLEIKGGDTELDKTVIDKIGDPLTHLIRNAMDHGIELPIDRTRAGKQEEGVILLNAFHETGSIVIEINDDGRGLNETRIREIAQQRGLISSDQTLNRNQILRLIFEPGFSTAETVNNLSGRGVGMDVVRRNIEALRGVVDIRSEEGKGATITIRLPLTLAIIDGFHVIVGNDSYIIPLDMMVECVTLTPSQLQEVQSHDYINLREEILPLINLRRHFNIPEPSDSKSIRQNVVVAQFLGRKVGLLVDALQGEAQAVIKPLGDVFQGVNGFAGFTLLADGQVAMIMDVQDMINVAIERDKRKHQQGSNRSNQMHQENCII